MVDYEQDEKFFGSALSVKSNLHAPRVKWLFCDSYLVLKTCFVRQCQNISKYFTTRFAENPVVIYYKGKELKGIDRTIPPLSQ